MPSGRTNRWSKNQKVYNPSRAAPAPKAWSPRTTVIKPDTAVKARVRRNNDLMTNSVNKQVLSNQVIPTKVSVSKGYDPSSALLRKPRKSTNRFIENAKRPRRKSKPPRTTPRRGAGLMRKGLKGAGILGVAVGATAMLGAAMLKGAFNQASEIEYERYMQDAGTSRNVLNAGRLGLSPRMQDRGSTMGLSNALSRTRHGRGGY